MHRSSSTSFFACRPRSRRVPSIAFGAALILGLLLGNSAFAQGLPTATIMGRVTNEGQPLPGVTVTATSPALQGARVTATSANGGYVFAAVPPGAYTIAFTLQGFQPVTKSVSAGSSQQIQQDATLSVSAIAAETTVSAKTDSISQTTQEATTYSTDLLAKLPTGRTITSAVILSPGLNQNGPNGISIAGAQSTENLYTVNGVVITDNVRSTANNLFIEDAIQETTTITSTVSAEYGRFTGGVINTITKSGGNTFSGSVRSTFTNDAWASTNGYRVPATGVNPQEGTFLNTITPTYEATFGGPLLKDKVWFFGAGRYFDTSDSRSTVTRFTNIPVTFGAKETRYEGKLTISPLQNHTLTGSYIGISHSDVNYNFDVPADTNVFYNRQLPQSIFVLNYAGVLSSSLFVDGFYSKRKFSFQNAGSTATDLIGGTPIKDTNLGVVYNSPTFCACNKDDRNNNDVIVKGTYFFSTPSLGSHTLLGGYDDFGGQRESNNYQSGSNYTLYSQTASIVRGSSIYPVFDSASYLIYWPVTQVSQGNDLRTRSAFLNDTWRLNERLSFNVGVRYDKNHATDQGGNVTSNDSSFSPRLAGSFDVKGDGKLRINANYAKYVAALQDTQAGSGATLAGSPAIYYWYYDGPGATPINADPTKTLLSPADSVKQFFAWWQSQGCLPDPLAASCKVPLGGPPSISGVNIQIQNSLASPYTNEYVLGLAGNVGSHGSFRADFVRRVYGNFYDLQKDTSTGKVTSPVNPDQRYDLGLITISNDYTRNYTGLHTQFSYRVGSRLNLGGNWTWSHLIGDYVGETSGSGPTRGGGHAYPEYFDRAWNNPTGSLSSDTRHRVRIFGTYDAPIPARLGSLNVSAIQSFDSGNPYGAVGSVKTGALVKNPGYLTPPTSVSYYFTGRDAYKTEDIYRTDLALTYSYKFGGAVELYLAPQLFNIFNNQHVIAVNQTVNTAVNSSSFAAFNPFTNSSPIECPQGTALAACKTMGANYQKGSLYGHPTSALSYQSARSFQFSVGVRF